MKANLARLRQDLKAGRVSPAYLFHGPESYLVEQALHLTLEALLAGADPGFNLEVLTANEAGPAQVRAALAQFGLLGGRRVVAVKHVEEAGAAWLAELIPVLEGQPPESHLVLAALKKLDGRSKLVKYLEEKGTVVDCQTPGEADLLAWLGKEAEARGKRLGEPARILLRARTGDSLADLAGEVEKLALFVHPAEEITVEDVKAASAASRGYTNFDLGDAVGRREGLKALAILHHLLLSGEAKLAPALVGVLAHRLRTMWQAKILLDQGLTRAEAAKAMKGAAFYNREYVDQSAAFSKARLAEAVDRLHQADLAIKTGAPARERLEDFILWLCGGD